MKLASFLAGLILFAAASVRAEGVVEDCTEQDLRIALTGGGEVLFLDDCSLVISNTIVIDGEDVTIDGGEFAVTLRGAGTNRVFEVRPGASLTLLNLAVTSGRSTNGAGIYVHPAASVLASNCLFSSNSALGGDGTDGTDGHNSINGTGGDGKSGRNGTPAQGGAVFSAGDFIAQRCQFLTNSAAGGTGGNGGSGGNGRYRGGNGGRGGSGGAAHGAAIYSSGTLEIVECAFAGNTCTGADGGTGGDGGLGPFPGYPASGGAGGEALGAAVYAGSNTVILSSTFEFNNASGGDSQQAGMGDNRVGEDGDRGGRGMGGALYATRLLSVTNCTFTRNTALGGAGGSGGPGQFVGGDGGDGGTGAGGGITGPGTKVVVHCTLVENSVRGGTNGIRGVGAYLGEPGNLGTARGGNVASLEGTFQLVNTIIGTNSSGAAGYGKFIDGGNNLSADGSIQLGPTSKTKTDPRLGPFSNNGGPTRTFPLLTNSPAIDRANPAAATDFDQRGIPRPVGVAPDIGAFEYSHTISGRVMLGTSGLANVQIEAGETSALTDSTGSFQLAAGDEALTLIPSLAGYSFSPSSQALSVTGDITGITFTATRLFTLNGRILEGTNGVPGVNVLIGTNAVTTRTNGTFSLALPAASYLVVPSLACYRFAPTNQTINLSSSTNRADFTASRLGVRISGKVSWGTSGLAGVAVNAGGQSAMTDTNGVYTITNVCPGAVSVVPTLQGYTFMPSQADLLLTQDIASVNFTASTGFTIQMPLGALPELSYSGTNSYRIEASVDLISWEPVLTNTGPVQFRDMQATNYPSRFYRLRP